MRSTTPGREAEGGRTPGPRSRRRQLRDELWVRQLMLRARLAMVWPGIRHRFGLHTFCEHHVWDLGAGYKQYRGWRCLICDEPLEP